MGGGGADNKSIYSPPLVRLFPVLAQVSDLNLMLQVLTLIFHPHLLYLGFTVT
ncbi:putative cytochrome c bioproteinsis factor [Yersinia aldovae 670-83]|nr:putative cytochrome c bioproteinsis factor [Yersinia aldovae 670-83]